MAETDAAKTTLAALLLLVSAAAAVPAWATDAPRSFSLSTTRTFAPGESVKIQLIAHNVPELEFRVYKVRDAEKFFAGLKDLHSFGVQSYAPQEQIDQRDLRRAAARLQSAPVVSSSGTSSAANLPTMRATASASSRPSWASAARLWARRSSRRFRC